MDKKYILYLLKKTKQDYNLIAEHFASGRYSIAPEKDLFSNYITRGDVVLDLGCGDGRLFQIFRDKNIDYTGIDISEKLIEIAKRKNPNTKFIVGDALKLPFPDNSFTKVFNIAVLHHIPSKKLRLQLLSEAKRVLKPDGLLILTVWNLWDKKSAKKLFLKYTLLKLIGKSKLGFRDILFPWQGRDKKVVVHRYFHIFSKKEIKRLVQKAGLEVEKMGIFKREETKNSNIYLIAKK